VLKKSTVLITGASSGIGEALAYEFSSNNYNLVLVGRNRAALEKVKSRCGKLWKSESLVIQSDLTVDGAVEKIVREVDAKGIEIDVLVNNAGYGVHGNFLSTELSSELKLIQIQIQVLLEFTKAILPMMINRGKGGIINVASVYSFSPVPQQAVYGACKAFMLSFAEALAIELRGKGITVTTVCPGTTQTEFRKRSGVRQSKTNSGMSSKDVARLSYEAFERDQRIIVPGALNRTFVRVCRMLPVEWIAPLVNTINRARGLQSGTDL
jgi:short-subunit dehydrogenase